MNEGILESNALDMVPIGYELRINKYESQNMVN